MFNCLAFESGLNALLYWFQYIAVYTSDQKGGSDTNEDLVEAYKNSSCYSRARKSGTRDQ